MRTGWSGATNCLTRRTFDPFRAFAFFRREYTPKPEKASIPERQGAKRLFC